MRFAHLLISLIAWSALAAAAQAPSPPEKLAADKASHHIRRSYLYGSRRVVDVYLRTAHCRRAAGS